MTAVSIVVPARNAASTLGACLGSILRAPAPVDGREVVVVDNASRDSTSRVAAAFPVRVVREPRRGVSWARNRGILESRGEIVAFVDADCVAARGWLAELLAGFEDPHVDGVAGEILAYPPGSAAERFAAGRKSRLQHASLSLSRPFAVAANVAYRRRTFERIGLFDPDLIRAQDKDFSWRFHAAGLVLQYRPRAIVLHRHPATAWGFLRQHAAWGYGAALLQRKHGLGWSAAAETRKWAEIATAAAELARATVRSRWSPAERRNVETAAYEMLRRGGLRVGATAGLLVGRFRAPSGG